MVTTANEDYFDAMIRHQIGLERFSAGVRKRILSLLDDTERDLRDQLRKRLGNIEDTGFDVGRTTTKRIKALITSIENMRFGAWELVEEQATGEALGLAEHELGFQENIVKKVLPLEVDLLQPSAATLKAAVTARPFQGAILKDWFKNTRAADLARLKNAIKLGFAEGNTTAQIVARVAGTRANNFKDGALSIGRRSATTVVRTALTHTSNMAREVMWAENKGIVDKLRWTSTLDGRTSAICQARSGKLWPVNEGPRPPAHPNCRSVMVAVFDGIGLVGERPFVRDTRTRRVREIDFRREAKAKAGAEGWKSLTTKQRRIKITTQRQNWARENIGTIPAEINYNDWLKGQGAAFQDDVLGKGKAAIFRRGKLKLDKFVNRRGQELTLDQLRALEQV